MPESKEKIQELSNKIQESEIRKQEQKTGLTDVEAGVNVPPEVQSWLHKIEMDPASQKTVTDDSGKPVLQPTQQSDDTRIKIRTTKTKFADGFKKGVEEAGRWLSTFVFRLIKIKKGKVKFEEN